MELKRAVRVAIFMTLASILVTAQDYHKATFNVGGGFTVPLGQTGDLANTSGVFVLGGGINFNPHFAFTGEFMWNNLPPSDAVLAAVLAPDASARLYGYTGNFIYRIGATKRLGAYLIGGGGWYHRSWELTAPVLVPGTVCGPAFGWYGVTCVNGLVPADAVLRDGSDNGGGWNVGGGLTFGKEGPGPKIYTEVRYHRALFSNIDTEVLPVTFGIRW
jgi:hypothetical protein